VLAAVAYVNRATIDNGCGSRGTHAQENVFNDEVEASRSICSHTLHGVSAALATTRGARLVGRQGRLCTNSHRSTACRRWPSG
jgi:hypothetical protein